MRRGLFTADKSLWLQKPLNVATLTAVQGHSSNDGVRESWKDEGNRRGCKSAEVGSVQVDETFLGRLPPGSAGPRRPVRHSHFFTLLLCAKLQRVRLVILWHYRKFQIYIISAFEPPSCTFYLRGRTGKILTKCLPKSPVSSHSPKTCILNWSVIQ